MTRTPGSGRPAVAARDPHRRREVLAPIVAALAALALTITTTAVWVQRTAFDTESFMALVEPTLTDEDVSDLVAARITDDVLTALALDERLAAALSGIQSSLLGALADTLDVPANQRDEAADALSGTGLDVLAVPLAAAVEERVAATIERVVASTELRELLVEVVARAHEQAVLLLRGELERLPAVVVDDDVVSIDLRPLAGRVLSELAPGLLTSLGLPDVVDVDDPVMALESVAEASGRPLDPSFGRLPVMSTTELAEMQSLVRQLDRWVWWLVAGTGLLMVAGVTVARTPWRGVRDVALAAVVGYGLALLLVRVATDRIADVGTTAQEQAAILDVVVATLSPLRSWFVLVLVLGLALALAAHVATRPRWLATITDRFDAGAGGQRS